MCVCGVMGFLTQLTLANIFTTSLYLYSFLHTTHESNTHTLCEIARWVIYYTRLWHMFAR